LQAQSRDKLGDRRSENDKIPTIVWKKYKAKRKKDSGSRRGKDCEIDSR